MVRASQRTGPFYCLGAIQLPSEMLLRVAIRLESANRIVFPNGRDQDVAFEHGAISMGTPHVHLLRWLALEHDILPSVFRLFVAVDEMAWYATLVPLNANSDALMFFLCEKQFSNGGGRVSAGLIISPTARTSASDDSPSFKLSRMTANPLTRAANLLATCWLVDTHTE
jgi:hypothetical protein